MKKGLLLSLFVVCHLFANSQNSTSGGTSTITPGGGMPQATRTPRVSVAPPEVVKAFEAANPKGSAVIWKIDGENFKVHFTDPDTKMEHIIVYDKEGNVLRSESEADYLTYPSDIGDYYKSKYPKESFKVWQTEREPGKINYFIVRKGKYIWFDQTGKVIPQEDKTIK